MANLIKKSVIALVVASNLCACVTQDYKDHKTYANSIRKQIDEKSTNHPFAKVAEIDTPPVSISPINEVPEAIWANKKISLSANQMPLSLVLNEALHNVQNVNLNLDGEVNPNKLVTLRFNGKLKDFLNTVANETGYGFKATASELIISKFETESFAINFPGGVYSGQLGGGETDGSKGATNTKIQGQFLNVKYKDVDLFKQLVDSISTVLIDHAKGKNEGKVIGSVEAVAALSEITVTTTPSRMSKVKRLVEQFQKNLEKQVVLDIRVLEFKGNHDNDRGIDWSIVKTMTQGKLKFYVPSTTTLASGSSYGLAFEGFGNWDGTSALIKALSEQGDVSTETPITALALNGQPSRISQTMIVPYLSEVQSQVTNDTVTASVTRGETSEGVDMMITPSVHDNYVWLRIAGRLTKIVDKHTESVADTKLTFLDTRNSEINFVNRLRYGQTVVIASIKQKTKSANQSKNFGIAGLGSEQTGTKTVETLVLLTPRKAE